MYAKQCSFCKGLDISRLHCFNCTLWSAHQTSTCSPLSHSCETLTVPPGALNFNPPKLLLRLQHIHEECTTTHALTLTGNSIPDRDYNALEQESHCNFLLYLTKYTKRVYLGSTQEVGSKFLYSFPRSCTLSYDLRVSLYGLRSTFQLCSLLPSQLGAGNRTKPIPKSICKNVQLQTH